MFRPSLRGVSPLFVLVCAFSLAGPASAQFQECVDPNDVPPSLLATIVEEAGWDFGDVSEQVCNQIANKGESTCKAQVKASAQCLSRSVDTNYDVAVKQCNQLDNPDRSDCKDFFKEERDDARDQIKALKEYNLGVCQGDFANDLLGTCLLGPT
jgi:hypothetical protein